MSKLKYYLFSNFKQNIYKHIETNSLIVNNLTNTNLINGNIKSEFNADLFLKMYYSNDIIEIITELNMNIYKNIVRFIPFEYFDSNESKYKLRMFIITNENTLYELNNNSYEFEFVYEFNNKPNILFSNDELYISNNNVWAVIENENTVSIKQLPSIFTYTQDNNNIYFSTNNNPFVLYQTSKCKIKELNSNIEQYNKTETTIADGEILNIINLNNKIYIVCQYSILQLNNENNKLSKAVSIETEILNNTIQYTNDSILFSSNSKIYIFDGNNYKSIMENDRPFSKNANSVYFNENYYIFDNNFDNYIVKYCPDTNIFSTIHFNNIEDFYITKTHKNYNLCLCQKINNDYFNYALYYQDNPISIFQDIKFNPITFNSFDSKIIDSVSIKIEGSAKLIIKSNICSTEFIVNNDTSLNNINLQGNYFNFELQSQDQFLLKSIEVLIKDLGE